VSQFSPPAQTVSTGFVVAIVGFFSSFPIVLQGLLSVGASDAQAASGLMAVTMAMGLAGVALSLWKREPISVAWSTPGVALLAVTAPVEGGFAGAVAGFLIAGGLTLVAGLWRPLGRLATRIPAALAQAMLAGVLISLCIAPFRALAETPYTALPIVLTWFVVGRFNRFFAVPAAVLAALAVIGLSADFSLPLPDSVLIRPLLIAPEFSLASLLGIGLPLFIVTMATQNIPGIAILRSFGYTPPPGPLLTGVGGASVLTAPFGAPAICLAAITAAMCCNEDSHPDPRQRYWSAVMGGVFYCVFGLFAVVITGIAAVAPPMVLATLAGVALIGIFANSAAAALEQPEYREAAAVTFLATASGMTVFGLSAAVWGLVLGGIVLAVTRRLAAKRRSAPDGK
jgi:benzoate membrane transport protein